MHFALSVYLDYKPLRARTCCLVWLVQLWAHCLHINNINSNDNTSLASLNTHENEAVRDSIFFFFSLLHKEMSYFFSFFRDLQTWWNCIYQGSECLMLLLKSTMCSCRRSSSSNIFTHYQIAEWNRLHQNLQLKATRIYNLWNCGCLYFLITVCLPEIEKALLFIPFPFFFFFFPIYRLTTS